MPETFPELPPGNVCRRRVGPVLFLNETRQHRAARLTAVVLIDSAAHRRSGGFGVILIGRFANHLGQFALEELAQRRRFAGQPATGKSMGDVLGCLVLHRFISRMKAWPEIGMRLGQS